MAQRAFVFRTWGGVRAGAGRRPNGEKAGVSHLERPFLDGKTPVHVTVRMLRGVWNLRTRRCLRPILAAMIASGRREEFHIVHASVQGNHIHFIIEARSRQALSRGMQGLCIRIAKGINVVMMRAKGRVFADRYHVHVLKSPTEVARAIKYVVGNQQIHRTRQGDPIRGEFHDPYSTRIDRPFTTPTTWLLATGWRRILQI